MTLDTLRPSNFKIPGRLKMASVALSRQAFGGSCTVDLRFCVVLCSAEFLSYNGMGALYGNNLIPSLLYYCTKFGLSLISHQLLLGHGLAS